MSGIIRYKHKYYNELNNLYQKNNKSIKIATSNDFPLLNNSIKIKLLKIKGRIKGYIAFSKPHINQKSDKVKIHEVFLEDNYATLKNYKKLLEATNNLFVFKQFRYAQLSISEMNSTSNIPEILNMKLEAKVYEMKAELISKIQFNFGNTINFKHFIKGLDEALRVEVQNKIFRGTKNHVDCCIKDIVMEENQQYFIEDGCIFIVTGDKTVGYSQIILENGSTPCIVNFGIVNSFRGCGFAKKLLSYTLNVIKEKGFNEVLITVDADNYKAINLYESMGFIRMNTFSSYIYEL